MSYFSSTVVYDGSDEPQDAKWEYKGQDGKVHGPFPSSNFLAWREQGYFTGKSAVQMRRYVNEPEVSAAEELMNDFDDIEDVDTTWHSSDAIDFKSFI